MTAANLLFRRQTSALLIRTWHWHRRQYCTLVCNLIIPPLALVLLAVLSRNIKPPEFFSFPSELRPKGAFVARPFDPLACVRSSSNLDDLKNVNNTSDSSFSSFLPCVTNPFSPENIIPVYAPDTIASSIGSHDAIRKSDNKGLLAHFSLDPFVYPPAIDPNSSFYEAQSPYDGVFLHYVFRGNKDNDIFKNVSNRSLNRLIDESYDSRSKPLYSPTEFLDYIYDEWFAGGSSPSFSTALTFDSYSAQPDGSLLLSSTLFYNESSSSNCTKYCSLVSSVVRLYSAVYKQVAPEKSSFAYLRRMPNVDPFNDLGIIPLIISVIIGLLTHFLFPVFLRFLVMERSARLRSMMASMGLRRLQYWFGTYLSLLILHLLCALVLIVVGLAMDIPFFTANTPVSYIVLFFLWANNLIALAMLFEPFFSNPETAQVVGWLFILLVNLIGGPYVGRRLADRNTSESTWSAVMLLPSFAYMRSVYFAGALNSGGKGVTLHPTMFRDVELGMCAGDGPFCRSYIFLSAEWLVFIIFAAYFDRVLSSSTGTRLHPLFFLGLKRSEVADSSSQENEDSDGGSENDVLEEKRRVREIVNQGVDSFDGVVLDQLSKTYAGNPAVLALKGLSLAVRRNEVLCILAHNGAGKTTAFGMLVGELETTSGTAYVCGNSVVTDMEKVHRSMGVTMQQDILWDAMSAQEHLFFYGRVKNLYGQELQRAVDEALDSVDLKFARKRQVKALSGGMKRRLSVSIAMIGNPDFIILDEPSTGLDILARQKLWEAIGRVKHDKIVMLTTHSLEEAEALSTRVAIMSRGELKCIGTADDLKMRLGQGHRLMVSLPMSKVDILHAAVLEVAPGTSVETVLGGNVQYVLPRAFPIARIFDLIQQKRSVLEIRDWSINQSSMEDVFLRVTKDSLNGVSRKRQDDVP